MPSLYKAKFILKILNKNGFEIVSQKGSHIKLRKFSKKTLTVIVPIHNKDVPYGTFVSICDQAEMKKDDFQK